MALASREDILKSRDWDTTEFDVDKWGRVRIRALTAKERLDLVEAIGGKDLSNEEAFSFYVRLLTMSIIDEQGNPLFRDEDQSALQDKSWPKLEQVAKQIMRFNGMDEEDAEKN